MKMSVIPIVTWVVVVYVALVDGQPRLGLFPTFTTSNNTSTQSPLGGISFPTLPAISLPPLPTGPLLGLKDTLANVTRNLTFAFNASRGLNRTKGGWSSNWARNGTQGHGGSGRTRNPILIVPGLYGSVLQAFFNASLGNALPATCPTNFNYSRWFTVWGDLEAQLPGSDVRCWKSAMALKTTAYGYSTPRKSSPFRIRAARNTASATPYLNDLLRSLRRRGYTADTAPYDFRVSPLNHYQGGGLFPLLKRRIEKMFRNGNGTKINLVGHSIGAPLTALFLNTYVNASWIDQHVKQFFSVSGVYLGSTQILNWLLAGDTTHVAAPGAAIRDVFHTFAGLTPFVPAATLWNHNISALPSFSATVNGSAFTPNSMRPLLQLFAVDSAANLNEFQDLDFTSKPKVPTHCVYGSGFDTPVSLNFPSGPSDFASVISDGNGDGVVSKVSQLRCSWWGGKGNVLQWVPRGIRANHFEIMDHEDLRAYLYRNF